MAKTLLLTGRPGVGKTTAVIDVVQRIQRRGGRAAGFYTAEIRVQGRRRGFRLVGLDGTEATLAHVRLKGGGRPRVGRYGVDVGALDRVGVGALRQALNDPQTDLLVIDEIGKMELFSTLFKQVVLEAVAGPTPVLGTIMARSHPWADRLKSRPQVTVWEITETNRDHVAQEIWTWLEL